MKQYNHPTVIWFLIALVALIAISCNKLLFNTDAETAKTLHQELVKNNIQEIPIEEVSRLLKESSNQPCKFDFDLNGEVDVNDFQTVLSGYGNTYTLEDVNELLINFGAEYIVDVIPLWNNKIQDVNCGLDWDATHRVKCNGNPYLYLPLEGITVQWFYTDLNYNVQDSLVSLNPFKMDWYTYGNNGGCNEFDSFQPLCNGAQTMTCKIFLNGQVYERTNIGVATINIPDSLDIPFCDNLELYEPMDNLVSDYEPYQYLN